MPRPTNTIPGSLAALLALLAASCARPAGVVFSPAQGVHVWPPPPDEPRVRFLGELRGSADLKPSRSGAESLSDFLFGKEPGRSMVSPIDVCTDGRDRVFIADPNAQAVHVFDLDSRRYAQWQPPAEQTRFAQPVGVAFDPAGRLLVSDSTLGAIFTFDSKGVYSGTLGAGLLLRPSGLAVEPDTGRVFVADAGVHQIIILSREGSEVRRLGFRGSGPGEFNFPTHVAFDSKGRLYVADTLNFRVQVFDKDLSFVRHIGRKGDMPGYFSQPKGLALDPEDHLYVVDAHFEAVQVFDGEGQLLMSLGREGHGPGEFWLPGGIAADAKGRLWIADSYNRRVQAFQYLPRGDGP